MRASIAIALLLLLPAFSFVVGATPVDVGLTSDAHGDVLSVSGTGNAYCATNTCVAVSGTGASDGLISASGTGQAGNSCSAHNLISASGTGDAAGDLAASGTGRALGCVPISGTNQCGWYSGDADCVAVAPSGDARGYWVAVAPNGNAQSPWVAVGGGSSQGGTIAAGIGPSSGPLSISGSGDSSGEVAISGLGDSHGMSCVYGGGCIVVSPLGNADATCYPPGVLTGSYYCLAVAPTGSATATGSSTAIPVSVIGTCNGVQCVSITPLGSGDGYWVAVAGTGDASAHWFALSLFGNADGTVAQSFKDVLCNPDVICVHSRADP